ncbi:ABC transporter substrate-binding protein [Thermoflexus sp.]|uniref:ABC transporter substrate-binding protein n=1 Tax=Thermoflexus sp. TaxID=1969742 RepID=UPI002621A4B4|nr:ABC transporter substrate-binding protein [Thermoflexus sp.]MCX7690715.1 ABC transporter substrate-binding protein [Thermoflexus sp.]
MCRKGFVSIWVLLALALAACAPGATPTPTATVPPPSPTPPPAATPTPAFQPMKVEAPDCNYGGEFKAIEAIDQYTVRFTLCYPDPAFPSKVAFAAFAIQDKDYLDANGGDSVKMSERPNGTGPYRVKEWIRGDRIIFEANPDYWGEKAKAKTLIFRWSKEAAARLLELQAGTVDGIDNPNPNDFATIERDPNLKLYIRPPLNIAYLGLNNTKPPLDNEKVRQAIAMAIDRERLVKNFYPAGSMVAEQFVPPALKPGYTEGLKWYDYNPEEAKRLLAEAGYPNGFDITLSYRDVVRGYLPEPGKVAQDLQAQLAEVGIRVEIKVMESGAFLDSVAAGNEPMYLLGWLADYPDATNFYDYHFANEANKQFGNLFPDLVQEIRAAAKLSDPAERQKHYDKVNELIKRHVPMIPLAHGVSAAAFKASVKGAHASPLNNEAFWVMDPGKDELVWMQNAEPIALWCADETDGETFRACQQVYEPLLTYKVGGVEVEPALAERYEANADLTVWTFYLRRGVKFHNGAELDANDVVATFKAQWDAKDPNHKGRTGTFEYFSAFFGAFLNAQQ